MATPPNAVVTADDVRKLAAFAEADDGELDELMTAMEPIHFHKGRTIIRQGAHGHGCFFLVSGVVRVVRAADPPNGTTPAPTSPRCPTPVSSRSGRPRG